MPIGYAEVRVNITSFVVDGIDSDDLPDDRPLTAQLFLTPMIQKGRTLQYDEDGVTKLKAVGVVGPIEIGSTGDISHQGRNYVKVVAPTAVETNLSQLQWKAEFKDIRLGGVLAPVSIDPIYFWVNPGDQINLADHVNVAASTAVVLSRGQRGYGVLGFESVDGDLVVQYESADGVVEQTVELPAPVVSADWSEITAKPPVIAAGSTTTAARSAISAASTTDASWSGLPGKPPIVAAGATAAAARAAIDAHPTPVGVPTGTKFLKDDNTWSAVPVGVSTWDELAAKPAVIAAGSSQSEARASIGAIDSTAGDAIVAAANAAKDQAVTAAAALETTSTDTVSTTGTYTLNSSASMFKLTLAASCTLSLPSPVAGKSLSIMLVQDATGTRTVTWPGNVIWQGGSAPVLSSAAGKRDVFSLTAFDGTNWIAFMSGKGF